MNARIEAAADHYCMYQFHEDASRNVWACTSPRCEFWSASFTGAVEHTVEAADAAMFSDEAIERVLAEIHHHISPVIGWLRADAARGKVDTSQERLNAYEDRAKLAARAVIAVLRDAPHATGGANGAGAAPVDQRGATGAESGA